MLVGQRFAGYDIIGPLGEGAMGLVMRAHQRDLDRDVALKFLHADPEDELVWGLRFEREIQLLVELDHPNLVGVYDFGFEQGRRYVAMELVEGRPLSTVIEQQGPSPVDEVLRWFMQLASALEYLHSRRVMHRDVKPANVLLDVGGVIKLVDFGLARGDHHALLTRASQLLGTPRYLAPEVIAGADHGAPSDIYSTGVVVYELLTGRMPYDADSVPEWFEVITSATPLPISRFAVVPAPLESLLGRMLSKKPKERPTATQLHRELGDMQSNANGADAPRKKSRAGQPKRALSECTGGGVARLGQLLRSRPGQPGVSKVRTLLTGCAIAIVIFGGLQWGSGGRSRTPPLVAGPGSPPVVGTTLPSAFSADSDIERIRRYLDSSQADADRAAIRRTIRARKDSTLQRFQGAARALESLSLGPLVTGAARRLVGTLQDPGLSPARRMSAYGALRDLWTIPATIDLAGETDPAMWGRVNWGPVGQAVIHLRRGLDEFLPQSHIQGPYSQSRDGSYSWLLREENRPRYMLAAGAAYAGQNRLTRIGLLRELPWVEAIELDMALQALIGNGDKVEFLIEGRGLGVHVQVDIIINGHWRVRIFPRYAVMSSTSKEFAFVLPVVQRLHKQGPIHRLGVTVPAALFEPKANRLRLEFAPAATDVADLMTLYPAAVIGVGARRVPDKSREVRARRPLGTGP